MRITSQEIAKLANVSRSTVSRVINNYPNVPEATREKVMRVIEEYGYEPSASAQILAGKSSNVIALFISDYNLGERRWRGMTSAYFLRLNAEMISAGKDYMISVYVVSEETDYTKIENMFLNKVICAGVFVGFEFQSQQLNELAEKGFRLVVIDPDENLKKADNVQIIRSDNEGAAYLATRYLLEQGHTRIAHIRGDNRLSGRERLKGFQRAVGEVEDKDTVIETMVLAGNYNRKESYEAAVRIMQNTDVTAIFAANDMVAIAALRAAEDLGKKVPEDIAIIGCDYVATYEDLGFHLTSVDMPLKPIAQAAVNAAAGQDKQDYTGTVRLHLGRTT